MGFWSMLTALFDANVTVTLKIHFMPWACITGLLVILALDQRVRWWVAWSIGLAVPVVTAGVLTIVVLVMIWARS